MLGYMPVVGGGCFLFSSLSSCFIFDSSQLFSGRDTKIKNPEDIGIEILLMIYTKAKNYSV
jgi:hypothetical protein